MGIPTTPGTPITFEQINDDLGRPLTNELDLELAGQLFGLDIDATNWSDGEIGLSMSEFRNAGAVATSAAITLTSPANYSFFGPTALFLQPQAVGNPVTNPAVTPSPGFITAGPHTLNFGVTANGTYVIYNALNTPPATVSPASGIDGAPPANNIHTITLPALPYSWDSRTTIPSSPFSPNHTPSTMYNGFGVIQDRFPSPIATANSLASFAIRRMYNDKYISSTVNPVPHAPGPYEVGWIDWRWGIEGEWTLGTSAYGNPLPDTDTSWVTSYSKGSGGTQPFTSNFYRQPIRVTVTANQSPTQTRQTQIFAFLPTAFNPTPYGPQMNKNGNPSNPVAYYYPITIIQDANPAPSPTMTITPSPISLDYSGTGVPVTLNVTPDSKTYSVSIVGPEAPNFSFTPNTSPKTNDATITVSATAYSQASPRSATLRTIIPAPNPVDIITTDATITQTGVSLSVGGFSAPGGTTDPVPFLGQATFTQRPIVTTAPSTAPWTVTKSPFITVPAITSGTGPSPTFGYKVSANPTYSPRPGHVTVDFNVGGNPYQTVFTIDQAATPAEPEFAIPSPVNTTETFNATSNPTKSVLVETNVPFTVGFTGDTAYWSRVPTPTAPATQTNFTVPFGAPTTYTISYESADNNDYVIRESTVTITSPVTSPTAPTGVYTKNFELSRNPGNAYLSFRFPPVGTVTGWSYGSSPAPEGGRLSMPGAGGAASLQVDAHPNLNWSLSVIHPYPGVPSIPNSNPIGVALTNQKGPKTWTLPSIPAGPPTGYYSYKFILADNESDVVLDGTSTSRQVGMYISTAIPEIVPTITISPNSISPISDGETKSISATGNAPFTKSVPAPQAPWLSVSPTIEQTAGPTTTFSVITTANTSSSTRSGTVSISSPAGAKTVSVTQAGVTVAPSGLFLAYNALSNTNLCTALLTEERWTDNNSTFAAATKLYSNSSLTTQAASGWYGDGTVLRKWTLNKNSDLSQFTDEVDCNN